MVTFSLPETLFFSTCAQGTIQAQLLLKQKRDQKQQSLYEAERKRVLQEKGIPEEHFLRKKRLKQFQSMLERFKKKQEERKLDIVDKLIMEDKLNKRAKKKLPHDDSPHSKPSKTKKREKRKSLPAPSGSNSTETNTDTNTDANTEAEIQGIDLQSSGSTSDTEELTGSHLLYGKHPTTVVEPEIRGLWEALTPVSKREVSLINRSGDGTAEDGEGNSDDRQGRSVKMEPSKAELLILKKAMEKLRKNKISKQIAAGREFKVTPQFFVFCTHKQEDIHVTHVIIQGQPFCSKPQVIAFRNFDVGKKYSKKVRLTNVSYTVNRCQLEGVSANLADFLTVSFDPPGSMSAGMSCSMQVTFLPQVSTYSLRCNNTWILHYSVVAECGHRGGDLLLDSVRSILCACQVLD